MGKYGLLAGRWEELQLKAPQRNLNFAVEGLFAGVVVTVLCGLQGHVLPVGAGQGKREAVFRLFPVPAHLGGEILVGFEGQHFGKWQKKRMQH